jgi:hypothetical protein
MKKSIYILASIVLFLVTSPIFAQADPGDDPVGAPIDDHVYILAAIGLLYVFYRLRAYAKLENTATK